MGIFTRRQKGVRETESENSTDSQCQIYVLIRSPDISTDEDEVRWSIGVLQSTNTPPKLQRNEQVKRKKSFLSFAQSQPKPPPPPVLASHPQHEQTQVLHEFTLDAGNLNLTSHSPSTSSHAEHPNSDSLLLQIQLPSQLNSRPPSPLALHLQLEQCLHRLTPSTSYLRDAESAAWLRLALIAMQREKFVAPVHRADGGVGLNVQTFVEWAWTQWAGFEGEVLRCLDGGGMVEDGGVDGSIKGLARYVRSVDYAAYMVERDRIKGVVGLGG